MFQFSVFKEKIKTKRVGLKNGIKGSVLDLKHKPNNKRYNTK